MAFQVADCSRCRKAFTAQSEQYAADPGRLCPACFKGDEEPVLCRCGHERSQHLQSQNVSAGCPHGLCEAFGCDCPTYRVAPPVETPPRMHENVPEHRGVGDIRVGPFGRLEAASLIHWRSTAGNIACKPPEGASVESSGDSVDVTCPDCIEAAQGPEFMVLPEGSTEAAMAAQIRQLHERLARIVKADKSAEEALFLAVNRILRIEKGLHALYSLHVCGRPAGEECAVCALQAIIEQPAEVPQPTDPDPPSASMADEALQQVVRDRRDPRDQHGDAR